MKKLYLLLVCASVALAVSVGPANARPQYKKVFETYYHVTNPTTDAEKSLAAAVAEAKCNVCHEGTSKKDRNAYGKAMAEVLPKYDADAWKADEAAKTKEVEEALKKLEAKEPFGANLKAGKLP